MATGTLPALLTGYRVKIRRLAVQPVVLFRFNDQPHRNEKTLKMIKLTMRGKNWRVTLSRALTRTPKKGPNCVNFGI